MDVNGVTQEEKSHLRLVMGKVADYVLDGSTELGVDLDDLSKAYTIFRRYTATEQTRLEEIPLARIIIDFALKPMRHVTIQVGDDEVARRSYLERMKKVIKHYWPAYRGENDWKTRGVNPKKPKMVRLQKALSGTSNEQVTLGHFLRAKREQEAWQRRAYQIVNHEDIYSNLAELGGILQYINGDDFRLIHREVLPHVTEGAQLGDLVGLYQKALQKVQPASNKSGNPSVNSGGGQ